MTTWAAVSGGLVIGLVLMPLPAVLWPRRAGYYYLRYHLSRRGIRTREIPPACLREFVADAFHYSRTVASRPSRPGSIEPRIPDFEFERMLRMHCFVVHALFTGRTAADDHAHLRELIRTEMLRAGLSPSVDAADRQRIENEVHAGRGWDRHRAILSRYDLPQPLARSAMGQLTQ
jgi:hypothetical protein